MSIIFRSSGSSDIDEINQIWNEEFGKGMTFRNAWNKGIKEYPLTANRQVHRMKQIEPEGHSCQTLSQKLKPWKSIEWWILCKHPVRKIYWPHEQCSLDCEPGRGTTNISKPSKGPWKWQQITELTSPVTVFPSKRAKKQTVPQQQFQHGEEEKNKETESTLFFFFFSLTDSNLEEAKAVNLTRPQKEGKLDNLDIGSHITSIQYLVVRWDMRAENTPPWTSYPL